MHYELSHFPGEPLAMLGGKTVVQRVYKQVPQVLGDAFAATDDQYISDAVTTFGGKAVMTSANYQSGTGRTEEVVEQLGLTYGAVLNIQGDEPFTRRQQIGTLCHCFDNSKMQIAAPGKRFKSQKALGNPNSSKIMVNKDGCVLYFSRSVIPLAGNKKGDEWMSQYSFLKHLGIYAYRREVLKEITYLPQSSLELAEGLGQLRWL